MGDWLRINDWVHEGSLFLANEMMGLTPWPEQAEYLGFFMEKMILCTLIFGGIMNTMFVILWMERKILGRLMDRRGAITAMRSLWVGENGVTAGAWWNKVPYGLGRPIGALNGFLNRVAGNRDPKHPTVDRVNNRSWHGVWFLFPGFFQNLADGMKFMTKEHMVPSKADKWIYEIAPFLIISSTVVILGFIPFSENFYAINPKLSVLFMMAIFGIAPLGVFFAGWSSNNKYTLLGGIRSAAQLTAYEIPMLIAVLSACILSGTFNLVELVDNQHYAGSWNLFLMPLGAAIFLIAMVAEVERIPFDMPEAEAELVEGWWTEYGGMRWGLMFSAEYMRTYAACFLFTHFFLGGWHAPFQGVIGSIPILGTGYLLIPGITWTLLKAWAVFVIFAWLRAALPRIRTDQILEFGWRYLLPLSIVQLVIVVFMRLYLFDAENLRFGDRGGFAWDGGIGLFLAVPVIVTFIFSVLFVLYSLDEEPGAMVERPFHAQTLEPAGTHKPGE